MKLYENCFDYKHDADDIINEYKIEKCDVNKYIQENWNIELNNFKDVYNHELDFMEQLSMHQLFSLVCMLDLSSDDYMEKCYEIQSYVVEVE